MNESTRPQLPAVSRVVYHQVWVVLIRVIRSHFIALGQILSLGSVQCINVVEIDHRTKKFNARQEHF